MSDTVKPFVVIHPAFGSAEDVRAAASALRKAGYVVLVGDPSAIKSVDVIAIASMSAIARAAFKIIAEHPTMTSTSPRTKFGEEVCKILLAVPLSGSGSE